jgi:hypothetical protein
MKIQKNAVYPNALTIRPKAPLSQAGNPMMSFIGDVFFLNLSNWGPNAEMIL